MLVSAMLKSADSFKLDLDFAPRSPSPSLIPQFVWKNQALNHFSGTSTAVHDVSDLPLDLILPQIYPTMSFGELANFYILLQKNVLEVNQEALFAAYRFRWDGRLAKMVQTFATLPLHFKLWSVEHELSPRDLSPISSLPSTDQLRDLYLILASESLGRSQGAQILELAAELTLMDNSWETIAPNSSREQGWVEQWLLQLKALRFPVTSLRDEDQQSQFSQLPWSKDFSTKWIRSGDKSGLEVKFLLTSKNDLQKKLEGLNRVHQSWNE